MSTARKIIATIAVIGVVAYFFYLWEHDPASSPAPQCWFHWLTGYDCPGCGTQRALYALLHGHVAAAWHYNAALFFAIPLAALYLFAPKRWMRHLQHPVVVIIILTAILAWWLLRNL